MPEQEPPKVHIPEVLPPESEPRSASEQQPSEPKHTGSPVSRQVTSGLIIDILDFAVFGPLGLRFGLPVGLICGVLLARYMGLGARQSLLFAGCVAMYCAFPGTRFLPLATVAGFLGQLDRR